MKILFATNHLWNFTGSELNLIGLARSMASRGHDVACHALVVSPLMRDGMQDMRLPLVPAAEGALVQFAPDVVFCQHHSAAASVRSRLPGTPMVLAHLGVEPELEQAPLIDCGAGLHFAISEEVRDCLVLQGISENKIRLFRNAVGVASREDPAPGAARQGALLFSYKLPAATTLQLAAATQEFGILLDTTSLTTHGVQSPLSVAARLNTARLVFASGRSALEAAIAGAAVVVLGPAGLDGPLTESTWRVLSQSNFSGRRHAGGVTAASLRDAITAALQSDAEATSRALRAEFCLERRAQQLDEILTDVPPPNLSATELKLNGRLSQLLHEHRLLAVKVHDMECEAERQRQLRTWPWWLRMLHRGGSFLHRVAVG